MDFYANGEVNSYVFDVNPDTTKDCLADYNEILASFKFQN